MSSPCLVERNLFHLSYSSNVHSGVQISKVLVSLFWNVYAAYAGSCLPTVLYSLSVPSARGILSPRRAKVSTTPRWMSEMSRTNFKFIVFA